MSDLPDNDQRWMAVALTLARRGLGNVWPNPAVGCVLVAGDHIVGRGWTQPGGRPHAETMALTQAGDASHGATAYVTLEPCAHHGQTAPCADALIAAGVGRVVVALTDPDPRVSGRGVARLQAAGIAVSENVCAAEAQALNAGFLLRVTERRPMFTLKLATSLDGRIATRKGDSKWITGPQARAEGHKLRANHDAIMIGSGTALADDPMLTCRLPGRLADSPLRIVCDGRLRIAPTAALFTADGPAVWVATTAAAAAARQAAISAVADRLLLLPAGREGGVDLLELAGELATAGITRGLIEGGGALAAAALSTGLVNELVLFRGPVVIGGDGLPSVASMAVDDLTAAYGLKRVDSRVLGDDVMESYRQQHR